MWNNLLRVLLGGFFALGGVSASAAPLFLPIPVPRHIYGGGWEHFVGGGIAGFDCNADGLPELYAAGGDNAAMLLLNRSKPGGSVAFADKTPPELALGHVIGAYPLDIDGDGIMDLAILRVGRNLLLKGRGNCRFEPFKTLGFTSTERWTTAFSATWEAGRALPTLAFGNYVDRSNPDGPFQACDRNFLYRATGRKYGPPMPLLPGFCPLSMLFSDWHRRGRADLRISNDRHYYVRDGQEQLWRMGPTPRLYGIKDGWRPQMLWGMGIASRDITGDGLPEVFLSSMGDQKLETLEPGADGPSYAPAAFARGTTAHRPYTGGDGRPSTGWQISFGDIDNDGRDDVFIAKGNVDQMMNSALDDPNNLLMQGADGRFSEAGLGAGIASLKRGRGAVLMDFNGDGLLDLAVVNRRAPLEVYQNVTPDAGNWLSVTLRGQAPNINALGAWLEVRANGITQSREITVGGGHASGRAGAEHFGLGAAGTARLRVIWPGGEASRWTNVEAGRSVLVSRSGTDLEIR